MVIDMLTIFHFHNLNMMAPRGHQNAGGGMACLMNAAKAALSSRYKVNTCLKISELQSNIVLLDALFIPNRIIENKNLEEVTRLGIEELKKDRADHPNRKYLLWCAEITLLRLLPRVRQELIELVDGIAVNDPYIENIFRAINVTPTGYLCDCIDPNIFHPAEKDMTVTAVGGLKHIKNIDWIIEVYKRLEGKMKRTYLGSASLWSHGNRLEDAALIPQIEAVTEEYHPNASPVEVAYHNAHAAFAVNDTWHDCSSRANEELLMSGVISIHGQHPLFDPRPGFRVKTPEEALNKIAELTKDFTELPDPKLHQASRNWALKNVSTQTFMKQFENIMRTLR